MAENENTKLTRGDLEKMIGGMVEKAIGAVAPSGSGGGSPTNNGNQGGSGNGSAQNSNAQSGTSVAEQVRNALGQITKEREEKERNERIDEQLLKLQESNREKIPVERGFLHKFMGWGENEV